MATKKLTKKRPAAKAKPARKRRASFKAPAPIAESVPVEQTPEPVPTPTGYSLTPPIETTSTPVATTTPEPAAPSPEVKVISSLSDIAAPEPGVKTEAGSLTEPASPGAPEKEVWNEPETSSGPPPMQKLSDLGTPESGNGNGGPHWPTLLAGLVLGILITAGVVSGWWWYTTKYTADKMAAQPTPTPTATSTPTPTPTEAVVKKDAYQIVILNGSGVAGAAGKLQGTLQSEGYKVSDTGNADKRYDQTFIRLGADVDKNWAADLKTVLGEIYDLGTDQTNAVATGVEIVIGAK